MNFSEEALFKDDPWITAGPRLTFSHSGEDRFLSVLFQNIDRGFYVDFGCFHPTIYSNTFLLYRRGWRGLNLDANPDAINSMNRERPDDINVFMAVAEERGTAQLTYFGEFASSNTISRDFAADIVRKQGVEIKRLIDVACDSTAAILDKFLEKDTKIDYWNVDLEGFDLVALRTNNWAKYRPTVISVEDFEVAIADASRSKIHSLMTDLDYAAAGRYLYTTFYIDRSAAFKLHGVPKI